ncbi:MAG: hypothetical protein HDR20_15335 [Lachnospiraceae bacterium]|nr:hypothetical protein [Lachnospiraceae bacterium]
MLWEKNKILPLFAMVSTIILMIVGCADRSPEVSELREIVASNGVYPSNEGDFYDPESIAAVYRDIYEEAIETNTLCSLETLRRIITRLGENGYVAVDSENQVDMVGAEQVVEFCKAVDEKKNAKLTIIVIKDLSFQKFDMETENGNVDIVRGYYQYDQNGCLQNKSMVSYPADIWQYTEEGYLLFEGSYFSDENFVLTLSDTPEHTALRVLPLDEKCRELNRKYILPVGYEQNNIFLTDWNEEDFGDLDFYDIFDTFYPILNKQPVPYTADENLGVGAVYQIPEEVFENVITEYFNIGREMLRQETTYLSEDMAYEYRPRGFYEAEYSDIPYPEVVGYTENQDGTITLIVNAVCPNSNTSMAYSHRTVIRPINEDCFQYVSNQMISLNDDSDLWWHSDRLSQEEWIEIYGETENSFWFLPQAENCLITKAEKDELKDTALTAAEQVREVYKDIELVTDFSFGSNIKEFTRKQCREVVTLLGRAGYVSVTENTNMENYEKVEDFYTAYMEKQDAMVTIFDVNRDGLIGAVTFIYRDNELQTYYVGIGWQEGGIPEIKDTLVSDIAEIKLTEKGYFIYAHEDLIPHSSLRQYWRIKPLSDKCRELTAKYVYGLSYVNYNVLVTNWDSNNVEDILMPCMFEDIYRIHTGENLKTENGRIPADIYEKIMTTYFPVSVEQLREKCGFDEKSNSYEYDMIFGRQYPPFGEVVDYSVSSADVENSDGAITLVVDGVWADYNSDLAFTNIIVVQPFADGTFRYLSNSIEQKELEIP